MFRLKNRRTFTPFTTYRKQRKERRLALIGEQVQQATLAMHASGRYPSQHAVQSLLLPGTMRTPEAKGAWHAALRELGLGDSRK